jgi:cytochrome c biogenesis protein ResB
MRIVIRWLRKLWHLLGSTRLAAILLAALLLASLLASFFPQMPAGPAARDPQGPWLATAALRYRQATGLIQALGLFDAYHAAWFLALLAALLLSTLACTVQRLPRLWRICTEQGRWAQAGTVVSHAAALLLLAAVIAGPVLGWQESGVVLSPGQVYSVGHGQRFAVQAGPLAVDRYPDGHPKDYRVPLTILVDASPVMTRTVHLNHPLTFRGVAFHLQSYRPAEQATVWQVSHDPTFGLAIGLGGLFLAGTVISLWVPQPRRWLQAGGHKAGIAATAASDDSDLPAGARAEACGRGGKADG